MSSFAVRSPNGSKFGYVPMSQFACSRCGSLMFGGSRVEALSRLASHDCGGGFAREVDDAEIDMKLRPSGFIPFDRDP